MSIDVRHLLASQSKNPLLSVGTTISGIEGVEDIRTIGEAIGRHFAALGMSGEDSAVAAAAIAEELTPPPGVGRVTRRAVILPTSPWLLPKIAPTPLASEVLRVAYIADVEAAGDDRAPAVHLGSVESRVDYVLGRSRGTGFYAGGPELEAARMLDSAERNRTAVWAPFANSGTPLTARLQHHLDENTHGNDDANQPLFAVPAERSAELSTSLLLAVLRTPGGRVDVQGEAGFLRVLESLTRAVAMPERRHVHSTVDIPKLWEDLTQVPDKAKLRWTFRALPATEEVAPSVAGKTDRHLEPKDVFPVALDRRQVRFRGTLRGQDTTTLAIFPTQDGVRLMRVKVPAKRGGVGQALTSEAARAHAVKEWGLRRQIVTSHGPTK